MSLSVLETMSILRPMEQNLARLNLNAYSPSNDGAKDDKSLQKWLDNLASLVVGCSPSSPSGQACAVSLSLLQSSCIVTVAFNVRPTRPEDPSKLIQSIWNWMQGACLPGEDSEKKKGELCELILEASLDRIRRRVTEKGKFVDPLIKLAKSQIADLTERQMTFLKAADLLHYEILRRLGPDVEKPDFGMASDAFRFRVKTYEAAKSKLPDFDWLYQFESQTIFAAGGKAPSLLRYMEKLQKPYSQYVLIHKAVRKSFIRNALSIPLYVNVLPSPDLAPDSAFQSMDEFEARVRWYLRDALLSYLKDAASSSDAGSDRSSSPEAPSSSDRSDAEKTIDSFWQRIKKFLDENQGRLPPLLNTHCECILLRHHLDQYLDDTASPPPERRTPYPYFGVSKLSCFQCALYFEAYRTCELGPSFQTRGSHTEVYPCVFPSSARGHDNADEVIKNKMGAQLTNIIGRLLAVEINRQRKISLSSVDSPDDSPPKPFFTVDELEGMAIINSGEFSNSGLQRRGGPDHFALRFNNGLTSILPTSALFSPILYVLVLHVL
ncbi:hypothetical protein B0H12DRAFT_1162010 [Mycena haematopus]|nr:hypothetical protein B0H12DRAFT_1162010 [Mycena haematopus]